MSIRSGVLAVLVACGLLVSGAFGDIIVLDFEGLQDYEPVQQYYNGGTGGNGTGPGPDHDIVFSDNALAIIDVDAGGSGNFGGEPSPDTCVFFLSGGAVTMNALNGFDTGFSFYYTMPDQTGTVTVYDGLDATGNVLAILQLPTTPDNGAPDPNGRFSPFIPFGVAFSGVAMSVDFGGVANYCGFDNITLGTDDPEQPLVPEPATLTLLGLGISGLVVARRRKK